jgi:hypothetical protein
MKIAFIRASMTPGHAFDAMEPLPLAILSALTPDTIERTMFDDRIEEIPADLSADLIAMSVETFSARRAYQLAQAFHQLCDAIRPLDIRWACQAGLDTVGNPGFARHMARSGLSTERPTGTTSPSSGWQTPSPAVKYDANRARHWAKRHSRSPSTRRSHNARNLYQAQHGPHGARPLC